MGVLNLNLSRICSSIVAGIREKAHPWKTMRLNVAEGLSLLCLRTFSLPTPEILLFDKIGLFPFQFALLGSIHEFWKVGWNRLKPLNFYLDLGLHFWGHRATAKFQTLTLFWMYMRRNQSCMNSLFFGNPHQNTTTTTTLQHTAGLHKVSSIVVTFLSFVATNTALTWQHLFFHCSWWILWTPACAGWTPGCSSSFAVCACCHGTRWGILQFLSSPGTPLSPWKPGTNLCWSGPENRFKIRQLKMALSCSWRAWCSTFKLFFFFERCESAHSCCKQQKYLFYFLWCPWRFCHNTTTDNWPNERPKMLLCLSSPNVQRSTKQQTTVCALRPKRQHLFVSRVTKMHHNGWSVCGLLIQFWEALCCIK